MVSGAGEVERSGLHRRRRTGTRCGALSPVASEQSRSDAPSTTMPSTGTRSPAQRRIRMPGSISVNRQIVAAAVGAHDRRAARREPRQAAHGRPRLLAHHMVERAADQQEEEQRGRRVEIGVLAVVDRVVEAQAEGQASRRSRSARPCWCGRAAARDQAEAKENLAGIERAREAPAPPKSSGKPAGSPASAPDQTETESSMMFMAQKPATASARISRESSGSAVSSSASKRCAAIAERRAASRSVGGGFAVAPFDADALGREVHARLLDAGRRGKPALDRRMQVAQ